MNLQSLLISVASMTKENSHNKHMNATMHKTIRNLLFIYIHVEMITKHIDAFNKMHTMLVERQRLILPTLTWPVKKHKKREISENKHKNHPINIIFKFFVK